MSIANNSIDQRSRSYGNSEVRQNYVKWHLAPPGEWDVSTSEKKSAKHDSGAVFLSSHRV